MPIGQRPFGDAPTIATERALSKFSTGLRLKVSLVLIMFRGISQSPFFFNTRSLGKDAPALGPQHDGGFLPDRDVRVARQLRGRADPSRIYSARAQSRSSAPRPRGAGRWESIAI